MMPTPLSKATGFKQRAGSVNPNDKIETPHHTNKMIALFNRLNMPNFYKVDKITYSRGDISDLANRLVKRLDENEHLVDYERRKNEVTNREKLQLQNQVNNLVAQLRQDEQNRIKVRKQV